MKNKKINYKLKINVEVPFWSYKDNKLNMKAKNEIKKWLKNALRDYMSHAPLYIEGEYEDASCCIKYKVK